LTDGYSIGRLISYPLVRDTIATMLVLQGETLAYKTDWASKNVFFMLVVTY